MILKASTTSSRSHAGRLARHLLNQKDNDRVHVLDIRGVATDDPYQAIDQMHIAVQLTRGKKGIYQVSINPPEGEELTGAQFQDAISRIEEEFGLTDRARVIIRHVKEGRGHLHCLWQRTDIETRRLNDINKDYKRLADIARQFERDHDLTRADEPKRSQSFTHADHQQSKRLDDLEPAERKKRIRSLWEKARDADDFTRQLKAQGYELAQGRKTLVLVHSETGEILKGRFSGYLRGDDGKAPRKAELDAWREGLSILLPDADALREEIRERQHYDRDAETAAQYRRAEEAGIALAEQGQHPVLDAKTRYMSFAERLDHIQAIERGEYKQRDRNEETISQTYDIRGKKERIAQMKAQLMRFNSPRQRRQIERQLEAAQMGLANAQMRATGMREALEAQIGESRQEASTASAGLSPLDPARNIKHSARAQETAAEFRGRMRRNAGEDFSREAANDDEPPQETREQFIERMMARQQARSVERGRDGGAERDYGPDGP